MSIDQKRKLFQDFSQAIITCTLKSYAVNTITRKKDGVEMRVGNLVAEIVSRNEVHSVKIVVYKEMYIAKLENMFNNNNGEGRRVLVRARLSYRTYERNGVVNSAMDYVLGENEELMILSGGRSNFRNTESENTSNDEQTEKFNYTLSDEDLELFDESSI